MAQGYFSYDNATQTLTLNSQIQFTVQTNTPISYGIGFAVTNAFTSSQSPGGMQFFASGFNLSDSLGAFSASSSSVNVPYLLAPNTANLNDTTLTVFFSFADTTLPVGDVITLTSGSGQSEYFSFVTPDNISINAPVVIHDGTDNLIGSVSAVPESSTYALFGIGAIGMLFVLRRKRTA